MDSTRSRKRFTGMLVDYNASHSPFLWAIDHQVLTFSIWIMCEKCLIMYEINRSNFLGDFHIDWLSSSCPLKKKFQTVTSAYNLVQLINQCTRVFINSTGIKSSTCIDQSFANAAEICSKAVSKSISCSDHNIVAISRKT